VARNAAPVAAAPVAAQAVTPATDTPPLADTSPVTPLANPQPIASAEPAVAPAKASTNDNAAEVGLGLLGLAALGGLGAYAVSRRRRRVPNDETIALAAPRAAVAPPAAKPVQTAWVPTASTAAATPAPFMFERKADAGPATTSRGRSTDMIPVGPLPKSQALTDLFERMVAAAPDKDNPFKSDKRRRARVRWLMKQHEYRLADPDGLTAADRFNAGESGFDFRTYRTSIKSRVDEAASKQVIPA
jgi:hypothetical protein